MIYNKIKEKILLLAVVLPIMMLAQNEVCFEIEPNRDGSVGPPPCSAITAVVILAASCDTTL